MREHEVRFCYATIKFMNELMIYLILSKLASHFYSVRYKLVEPSTKVNILQDIMYDDTANIIRKVSGFLQPKNQTCTYYDM